MKEGRVCLYEMQFQKRERVQLKNKSGANNKTCRWNHLKIIQKITEPHTGKSRNKGTRVDDHIGHCTHTAESAKVSTKGS
jgi:hypothetical protein